MEVPGPFFQGPWSGGDLILIPDSVLRTQVRTCDLSQLMMVTGKLQMTSKKESRRTRQLGHYFPFTQTLESRRVASTDSAESNCYVIGIAALVQRRPSSGFP